VSEHVRHAQTFVSALEDVPPGRGLDLGSGGGVPGLILALARPAWHWVLLDSSARRTAFLDRAVGSLGLGDRVRVATGRAEDVGRRPDHRHGYQLVVARSFARPAVVAECAAPFLTVGGTLAVSEPPDGGDRWPEEGLGTFGLKLLPVANTDHKLAMLRQDVLCPDRFPRRVGIPAKRPLW
jgi:16S rRNA (guanine527-N7)-methyltransferase